MTTISGCRHEELGERSQQRPVLLRGAVHREPYRSKRRSPSAHASNITDYLHFNYHYCCQEYLADGGQWLHVDMAGPAWADDRGTGYGVALLSQLVDALQTITA